MDINDFGDLLLTDRFPMGPTGAERDYQLFLFNRILLCCKESSKKKKRDDPSTYTLKGNIYIQSVTGILDQTDPSKGRFEIKVLWKDVKDW